MCEQPLSTYLYANECSFNYGCSRWYYGKYEKMRKNTIFLHFFSKIFGGLIYFQ